MIEKLNITLPKAKQGVGAYKSWAMFSENIVCTSGQLPWDDNIFGDIGALTRTAQGMSSSPLNTPTLIYLFSEIEK